MAARSNGFMRHTAVLLAGGKSTRMGQDKAQIVVQGEPLWKRQLETLRQTDPNELLISARDPAGFRDAGCRVIPDNEPEQGPLGGIAATLERMRNEWLLVLAVDLPRLTSVFLRGLLSTVEEPGFGRVCMHADGKIEPLVAVYPRAALGIAQEQLRANERRLGRFIERLEAGGLISRYSVGAEDGKLFVNWNTPRDLEVGGTEDRGLR